MSDHYQTLQVDKKDSLETIKRSFRRLAKQFHPDLNPNDPGATERFRTINEAYHVLSDVKKRELYDRTFSSPPPRKSSSSSSTSSSFRKDSMRSKKHMVQKKITLVEIFSGTQFHHEQKCHKKCEICGGLGILDGRGYMPYFTCPYCKGRGEQEIIHNFIFDLPPGVQDGQMFEMAYQEQRFTLKIKYPNNVTSCGNDLFITRTISKERARKGTTLTLKNIHGRDLRIKVVSGLRNGTLMRLRGKGLRQNSSDLFIRINVS